MIAWAGRWTRTASTTPLHPKNEMLIFGLCWTSDSRLGWSMDSNPIHLPSQAKKNEMLIFGLHLTSDNWQGWSLDSNPIHLLSEAKQNEVLIFGLRLTSDDQPGWLMNLNPICLPCPAKKMKCSFLDYVQLLMIGWAGQWTRTPSATCVQPKKCNAYFWITFNFWSLAGLVDGLEPHLPPLSRHKMKCSFLHYVQLLMIGWAGWWTQTQSTTLLQPKKWNAHFWITFNFWWSAGLVDGLKPHLPPLSRQKNEMLIVGLCWTSDSRSPAKEWNAHFWITFNFWWLAGLVDGLELHPPHLSSQKNEMLVFGLCSTSDDWPGWSMDSNPICHPSPTKKMKCSFLDYVQLLMISQAARRTPTPSATSFQPKKWNAHFWIMFNFRWSARLVEGLQPHLPPLSNQKSEMLVFVLCYSSDHQPGWSMDSKPIHHLSSQKNEMLIFVLRSTSDDLRGWSMDSNPIHYPSPAKKMKCSFLYYIQLLMIGRAGHWTQTTSTSSLKPKKMKCSFLDYV